MKNSSRRQLALVLCALLLASSALLLAGCGGNEDAVGEPTAPASPTPEAEAPTATEEPAPEAGGTPAETLATSGQQVFAAECAECHGEQGEGLIGPALLGGGANLGAYGTAKGLYDYVHLSMPQDAPGSLTDQQYLEVIAYMLLDNGLVDPDTAINVDGLSNISLQ